MNRKTSKVFIILISTILFILCMNINSFTKDNKRTTYDTVEVMNTEEENKENETENKKIITNWNLSSLYKSDDIWKREVKSFSKEMKELRNYIGKVTKSKTHLSFALEIKEKLDKKLNKLSAYVKLKKDINKNSYKYLDMNDEINKVYSDYMTICTSLEQEILKLSEKKYKEIINSEKISKNYKMYLDDIRRSKKHYLDDNSENILNNISSISSLPGSIYNLFRNMDKNTNMTPSEYSSIMESGAREDRKAAYEKEFLAYSNNINTLSGLIIGQAKKNSFYSSQRGYKSSINMYLDSDNIDVDVYDNLINTVSKNTPSLHKYVSLRKRILKLDKLNYYDMFIPIVEAVDDDINYDKAQSIIYSALSPLGKEYGDILYKAFNERWIDVYSSKNKVSGGYCLSVYDNNPFILLNYNNTISSVSTLAHELGHAAYEYLSSKNQNYFNSNPSIFTHEVASTTNEALLYEVLIKNAKDDKEKAYYITKYLDLIKDTVFTQTMYAEFEKSTHELVESGKSINALVLNDIWSELSTKYYGKGYEIDKLGMVGWARIPHFYNSFYVYKYATGCSAGISFAKDIITNGPDNYLNFLKKGSSKYPVDLLSSSGIDITSKKPMESTIKKFDELLKELETIIEK